MSTIYRMVAITGPKEWNMWKEFWIQCDGKWKEFWMKYDGIKTSP